MGEIIKLDIAPKYIREAKKAFLDLPEKDAESVFNFIALILLNEVKKGIDGEEEGDFFKLINEMYDEVTPHGCYFCDTSIDVNAVGFDKDTVICMSCRTKLLSRELFYANMLMEGEKTE